MLLSHYCSSDIVYWSLFRMIVHPIFSVNILKFKTYYALKAEHIMVSQSVLKINSSEKVQANLQQLQNLSQMMIV